MSQSRPERRSRNRVQLTRGMMARFGATPAIVLDITDAGARIEHFVGLDVGRRGRFRLAWRDKTVEVEATVVRCRVQRFGVGDEGTTVYQSGLFFSDYVEDAAGTLRDLVSTHVARSLAEQVANARGIGPVTERNMPVFRSGTVAAAVDRGYVRCTMNGNRFDKKWSRTPEQPDEDSKFLSRHSIKLSHVTGICQDIAAARAFALSIEKRSRRHLSTAAWLKKLRIKEQGIVPLAGAGQQSFRCVYPAIH